MPPVIAITCARSTEDRRYALHHHYVEAVLDAGGLPLLLPGAEGFSVGSISQRVDGVILSGGRDVDPAFYGEEPHIACGQIDPIADAFDVDLCRHLLNERKPVLGICRGAQVLNVAAGGDLYQDIPQQTGSTLQHAQNAPDWYPTHTISIAEGSLLNRIFSCNELRVNSFHHQAVRRVAPGFVASAHAADGVIEAIEKPDTPFTLGVQWHPERTYKRTQQESALFRHFVQVCARESRKK